MQVQSQREYEEIEITCSECCKVVSKSDTICPNCGVSFSEDEEIHGEKFPCPDCGTMISETQTECSVCGRFFEGKEQSTLGKVEEKNYEYAHCSECGAEISDKDTNCHTCGVSFAEEEVTCSNCGATIAESATSCPKCGTTFSNLFKCPDCGGEVLENEKKCPTCGCVFDESEIAKDEQKRNVTDETETYCSNCGAIVNGNDKECSSCGESLIEEETINESDFQFWKETSDESELAYLKGMLEEENIEYVVMNERNASNTFPFSFRNSLTKIFVAKVQLKEANKLFDEYSNAAIEMPTTFEEEQQNVIQEKKTEEQETITNVLNPRGLHSIELKLFERSELKNTIRKLLKSTEIIISTELSQRKKELEHIFKQLEGGTTLLLSQSETETFAALFSFLDATSRMNSALENIQQKFNTFATEKN